MEASERREIKFNLMVREVERRIFYKIEGQSERSIYDYNRYDASYDFSAMSPLRLIFPEYAEDPYIKAIVSQVHTIIPYSNADHWINSCEKSSYFHSAQRRGELSKLYVQMHSYKKANSRAFIFWGMVGALASTNKDQFGESMSLVIDFARVFELKEDEILDVAQFAKAFFGEDDPLYKFKNREAGLLFSSVWAYLKS